MFYLLRYLLFFAHKQILIPYSYMAEKKLLVNLGQTNTVIDFWSLHCIVAVYLSPVIFFSLIAQYTLTFRGLHTNQYDKKILTSPCFLKT